MSELLTPEWPMPRWLSPGTLNRSTASFPVSGLPLFGPFLSANRQPLTAMGGMASAIPPKHN